MKYQPFETGHYFHLYNRGNNNENIYLEQENYGYFISLMKKYLRQIADVLSYCLLPNHFHIILKFKDDSELDIKENLKRKPLHQPISNMLNSYTKSINKRYNRRGSLFQEHLKRIKITEENYLKNLILYINTNPSHHQIEDYRTYKHSSYRTLISQKKTLLERDFVIELFNNVENFKYMLQSKKLNMEALREISLE